MSIWRKQGGIIGKPDGNVYPSSGSWDVTERYTDENRAPAGEVLFSTVQSSYSWTVPGDTGGTIHIICVGGGGGGGASTSSNNGVSGGGGAGGGLHWINSVSVTSGETLLVTIGAAGTGGTAAGQNNSSAGGTSNVKRSTTILAQATGGGAGSFNNSLYNDYAAGGVAGTGGGGGTGGPGRGGANGQGGSGGGGAAGYAGDGGRGAYYSTLPSNAPAGGGGGGGAAVNGFTGAITTGGGGVAVYGQGVSGLAAPSPNNTGSQTTTRGYQGSVVGGIASQTGTYGAGGTGSEDDSGAAGGNGNAGVVRIIWGAGRTFPSTNTDQASSSGNVTTI